MIFSIAIAQQIIQGLWIFISFFWFVGMFVNKRTVQRETLVQRFRYVVVPLALAIIIGKIPYLHRHFYEVTDAVAAVGDVLVAAGVAIAIYARVTLGTNWSGTVTLKAGHTLITSGPYRFVRHPIYTGLLVAVWGTVMVFAPSPAGIGYVLVVGISFAIKLRYEEELMMKQFPREYPGYRQRVKTAFVPLIW